MSINSHFVTAAAPLSAKSLTSNFGFDLVAGSQPQLKHATRTQHPNRPAVCRIRNAVKHSGIIMKNIAIPCPQ